MTQQLTTEQTAVDRLAWLAERIVGRDAALAERSINSLDPDDQEQLVATGVTLLDYVMEPGRPGIPIHLSGHGAIRPFFASELGVRGLAQHARRIIVSTWKHEGGKEARALLAAHGTARAALAVATAHAAMMLTWSEMEEISLNDVAAALRVFVVPE